MKLMSDGNIQYVSDENGTTVSVIVPIEVWREIESEKETSRILASATMRQRLKEAMEDANPIPFEEALEKLGIRE
jgi:hypothetical protein